MVVFEGTPKLFTDYVSEQPLATAGISTLIGVNPSGAVVRGTADVWVTDFLGGTAIADASGNDSYDASVAWNLAITFVKALGGGTVRAPSGFDSRIANPIILQNGVTIEGSSPVTTVDGSSMRSAVIRPSANLSALVSQADIATILHSAGIIGLCFDGRDGTHTVTDLIKLSPVNCRIVDNEIAHASGKGLTLAQNPTAAWINWVKGNSIVHNGEWGVYSEISDSEFSGNYISSNGDKGTSTGGNIWTKSFGGTRWFGNQIELGHIGFRCESVDTGAFAVSNEVIANNYFDLNNEDLYLKKGALGTFVTAKISISANNFNNATTLNIKSDGYHKYVSVIGNSFVSAANPSSCHIDFGAGAYSTGWCLVGNTYSMSATTRYLNVPSDITILDGGNGCYDRLGELRIGTLVKAANLTIAGSDTYRGDTNVAAAFGVSHADESAISAAVLIGSVSGVAPFIAASYYNASNATASWLDFKTSNVVRATISISGDIQMGAARTTVIDASRHFRLRSYTVGTLPSSSPASQMIYVSDGASNKRLAVSDNTNWRWPDGAIVS